MSLPYNLWDNYVFGKREPENRRNNSIHIRHGARWDSSPGRIGKGQRHLKTRPDREWGTSPCGTEQNIRSEAYQGLQQAVAPLVSVHLPSFFVFAVGGWQAHVIRRSRPRNEDSVKDGKTRFANISCFAFVWILFRWNSKENKTKILIAHQRNI